MLWADLGTALCDVAVADGKIVVCRGEPITLIEGMHFQPRKANQEARPGELGLQVVFAQDMAGILAQKALDALAELLHTVNILLHHAQVFPIGMLVGLDALVDLVVPGDIANEVAYKWECFHRLH